MKIFIAEYSFDYEGGGVIGAFDTEEKAQEACDNYKYLNGTPRGDDRFFTEVELNVAHKVEI